MCLCVCVCVRELHMQTRMRPSNNWSKRMKMFGSVNCLEMTVLCSNYEYVLWFSALMKCLHQSHEGLHSCCITVRAAVLTVIYLTLHHCLLLFLSFFFPLQPAVTTLHCFILKWELCFVHFRQRVGLFQTTASVKN